MAKVQFPIGGNISVGSHDWIASVTGQGADLYFVSKDRGSNDNDGKARDTAVRTWQKAVDLATDNRITVVLGEPGEYNETLNINKRRIALIGDPRHPGATRITGDGSTARASVYVGDGFLSGFVMANLGVDTGPAAITSLGRPAIHLVTNDTGTLGAESADYHFYLKNISIVSDGIPIAALYLEGATMGVVEDSTFAGCDLGVVFGGSLNNFPADIYFKNIRFYNNVRADVASANSNAVNGHPTALALATIGTLDSVNFDHPMFLDVGGTPVTDYANLEVTTATNVVFSDARFARDVADGTLLQLGTNIVVLGHSPAGLESIVAA